MADGTSLTSRTASGDKRHKVRRLLVILAVIVVVLVVSGVVAGWALLFRAQNPVPAGQQVQVDIKRGSSATQIAEQLAKVGVVPNALMFRVKARNSQYGGKLKPGVYSLSTGMPYDVVFEKLASGPDIVYFDVTIPEGYTVPRVAARFAEKAGIPEDEFLKLASTGAPLFAAGHPYLQGAHGGSLEGFLFPKTYRIKKGSSAKSVIEMMLSQFDEEAATIDLTYAKTKNLNLTDVVIIASILERETQLAKEYPLVASVIYNRLHAKMRLQLDSTVFFGLPEGTKVLHKSQLAQETPYNTYRIPGLPAGPICSPGIEAMKAAAQPTKTDYLYYVLTSKDGSQTFTNNYPDFLKAVAKYRKVFNVPK